MMGEAPWTRPLAFAIAFDPTDLPEILRALDALCEAFPVIDAPPSKPRL
jgi:hypothetical protein